MSFFDDAMQAITGGGGSESKSESVSGFRTLPFSIRRPFRQFGENLSSDFLFGDIEQAGENYFKPIEQTDYETQALNAIGQGFAPDARQLNADINMQMNPYDDFVVDQINDQAAGEYSILKQALNEAGQMGSNRQMLGAQDIENKRLGTIGRLKQGQYNTALNNSLNTLANRRAQDATQQMSAGQFLRNQDLQERQAPITAMRSYGQLLGALPQDGGAKSTSRSESSQVGGILPAMSGFFGGGGR
jgi:hypothetical protein